MRERRGWSICSHPPPAGLPVGSSYTPVLKATASTQQSSLLPNSNDSPPPTDLWVVTSCLCQVCGGGHFVSCPQPILCLC